MSSFISQEIATITARHTCAQQLLDARKNELIEKIRSLAQESQCSADVFQKTIELNSHNQIDNHSAISNIANNEYRKYRSALISTRYYQREKQAVTSFNETRTTLLSLIQTSELNEKTKTAVREVIAYIDQYLEPSLWNRLFGRTPWHMLQNSLQQTCVLIEKNRLLIIPILRHSQRILTT